MAASEHSRPATRPSRTGLVRDLLEALGTMFDLDYRVGGASLGEAIADRLLALRADERPRWGTPGEISEVAREATEGLELFYRPHLFPGMDDRLRLAHHLQFDLLPRELPVGSPLRLSAVLESYCHLSGDLLGWRQEGDELVVWIADLSGHGVRAGLAAAVLYFLVADIEPGLAPAAAMERLNGSFFAARNREDERALYATSFWARFGPEGRGRYASAGHPPMQVRRAAGAVELLHSTGTPVGLPAEGGYGQHDLHLGAGDLLLLYTDGLVEATDREGRELGSDWLEEVMGHVGGDLRETTRAIYREISTRSDLNALEDDVTYLVATLGD